MLATERAKLDGPAERMKRPNRRRKTERRTLGNVFVQNTINDPTESWPVFRRRAVGEGKAVLPLSREGLSSNLST